METDRFLRLTATCATLAIHGALLAFLARPMFRATETRMAAHQAGLQIVWIPSDTPNPRVIEVVEPRAPLASSRYASPHSAPTEVPSLNSAPGTPPDLPVPRSGVDQLTLRLSLPPEGMEFDDDLMGKGRAAEPTRPSRMNLRLVDRSFGGTMQRMAKNRTCGDLRAALQQHPESTMTILRTMTRLGC